MAASNLYLLITRMWVYIWALQTAQAKGIQMAEEPQSVCEWLDIELEKLSSDDKITLIGEIGDTLSAQELIRVRTLADHLEAVVKILCSYKNKHLA